MFARGRAFELGRIGAAGVCRKCGHSSSTYRCVATGELHAPAAEAAVRAAADAGALLLDESRWSPLCRREVGAREQVEYMEAAAFSLVASLSRAGRPQSWIIDQPSKAEFVMALRSPRACDQPRQPRREWMSPVKEEFFLGSSDRLYSPAHSFGGIESPKRLVEQHPSNEPPEGSAVKAGAEAAPPSVAIDAEATGNAPYSPVNRASSFLEQPYSRLQDGPRPDSPTDAERFDCERRERARDRTARRFEIVEAQRRAVLQGNEALGRVTMEIAALRAAVAVNRDHVDAHQEQQLILQVLGEWTAVQASLFASVEEASRELIWLACDRAYLALRYRCPWPVMTYISVVECRQEEIAAEVATSVLGALSQSLTV
jgi:hypothetical protein